MSAACTCKAPVRIGEGPIAKCDRCSGAIPRFVVVRDAGNGPRDAAIRDGKPSYLVPGLNIEGAKIAELFGKAGASVARQTRAKYSKALVVRDVETGDEFELYMCMGVWRIAGACASSSSAGVLLELLNPTAYAGASTRAAVDLFREIAGAYGAECDRVLRQRFPAAATMEADHVADVARAFGTVTP